MSCVFDERKYSPDQMKNLHTKQLLKELRRTYTQSCPGGWACDGQCPALWCTQKAAYQAELKTELATREHIPNKIESKKIRIARKKKGN